MLIMIMTLCQFDKYIEKSKKYVDYNSSEGEYLYITNSVKKKKD